MNTKQPTLDHRKLYRLPWSLPDNAQAWLEPTKKCNLSCLGCFRENEPNSHKTLEEINSDIELFLRFRTLDSLLIAGGEPLVHPQICEIVAMVAERGIKPIVITNGLALTAELLNQLKRAGVVGFIFHIDSKQGRPGWKDKNEIELNELRLNYAEMVAGAKDIACAYNITVYKDTMQYVGGIVEWAQRNIDIVHGVGLIAARTSNVNDFDYYVNGEPVDYSALPYSTTEKTSVEIKSQDIVAEIRKRIPDFAPAAYLNGTESPDSFKWLLSGHIGTSEQIYGYIGPRTMELSQAFHHLTTGKYFAYMNPSNFQHGRMLLSLATVDPSLRRVARRYLTEVARRPSRLLERLYYQTVVIIQPVDFYADGRQNMCDGCPDITTWNGRLVWSCRIEETERFGGFAQSVPSKE